MSRYSDKRRQNEEEARERKAVPMAGQLGGVSRSLTVPPDGPTSPRGSKPFSGLMECFRNGPDPYSRIRA